MYLTELLLKQGAELRDATVLAAVATGAHGAAEGIHGLLLAGNGVGGVGKGVEEQKHATALVQRLGDALGVVQPVAHHGHKDIGRLRVIHRKQQPARALGIGLVPSPDGLLGGKGLVHNAAK